MGRSRSDAQRPLWPSARTTRGHAHGRRSMMDAGDVLRALKAGEISVEEGKQQLIQPQEGRPTSASTSPAADSHLGDHYGLVLSTVHHLDELTLREWLG